MAASIGYNERLIQSLETSLRSAFNQPRLWLSRRGRKESPGFLVSLINEETAQADDGREQRVLEVLTSEGRSTSFYFGFVADFAYGAITRKHILQHASLIVFHEVCVGELTSFFRAEWDEQAASDSSPHAQPHWHFVQSPTRIESIVRATLSPGNDFIPERESQLFVGPDCGKFHFAMVSMWDRARSPSYKQSFDADEFRKWFASLTKYIGGQIAYLVKHTPVEKEFTPSGA